MTIETAEQTSDLKDYLKSLAREYETAEFLQGDPSWFMHQVSGRENQETMAFIASCFSFGSRKQFLPKIQGIMECSGREPHRWILSGEFLRDIPDDDRCFYRMYTNRMVRGTFLRLQTMLREYGSIGGFLSCKMTGRETLEAVSLLVSFFQNSGGIVPKNTQSSCKRLCMFLRWMVRDGSPVDLGLWRDFIDKRTLIMPMDTHVMQQSRRLGLLAAKSASMATARKLTKEVARIFPDDPLKADFALFGYGVAQ